MPPATSPTELPESHPRAVLQQLLTERRSEDLDLPHLGTESRFFDSWKKAVENFLHKLSSMFSGGSDVAIGDIFVAVLQAAFALLLLLLVFWICSSLFKLWKRSSKFGSALESVEGNRAVLHKNTDLEHAIAVGNWPLAMRLRWKLFLSRARFAESLTPSEFFSRNAAGESFQPSVSEQYAVMFGGPGINPEHDSRSKALFAAFDQGLTPLEAGNPVLEIRGDGA